ncbi:hypothetical protein FA13DRAFT_1725689 [Coprinellus micaceus]|uniref:BTB domain-containing protein n=1 Tax=Coprinellus micaceus TaxID=71717 RepID=A0A4Y7TV74_COPMI|nr:hypothetical protein FA13DRAFT_1725689 [Coprinellus micaceus]
MSTPMLQFDEEYYWELVTFLVEGHIFRVPKHNFIEHSKTFTLRYLVGHDQRNKSEAEDPYDDPLSHAIVLDVSVDDFRCFLKALYPRYSKGLLKNEWLRVLKLSHQWSFCTYRQMAIEALTPVMAPTDKIVWGKEYTIAAWVNFGLVELVTRAEGISQSEAETIGWRNAIDLFNIREAQFASVASSGGSQQPFDAGNAINEAFHSDLITVHNEESAYLTRGETSVADGARLKAAALEERLAQQEWVLSQGKNTLRALKDEFSAARLATLTLSHQTASLAITKPPKPPIRAPIGVVHPAIKLEEEAPPVPLSLPPIGESCVPPTQDANPPPAPPTSVDGSNPTSVTALGFPPNTSPFARQHSPAVSNTNSATSSALPALAPQISAKAVSERLSPLRW